MPKIIILTSEKEKDFAFLKAYLLPEIEETAILQLSTLSDLAHQAEDLAGGWLFCFEMLSLNEVLAVEDRLASAAGILLQLPQFELKDLSKALQEKCFSFSAWHSANPSPKMEVGYSPLLSLEEVQQKLSNCLVLDKLLLNTDSLGLVGPRVLTQILNEAFLALEEGIASAEDIDMAMRLGTGYPIGPITWAKLIGPKKVLTLLNALHAYFPTISSAYVPSPKLIALVKAEEV